MKYATTRTTAVVGWGGKGRRINPLPHPPPPRPRLAPERFHRKQQCFVGGPQGSSGVAGVRRGGFRSGYRGLGERLGDKGRGRERPWHAAVQICMHGHGARGGRAVWGPGQPPADQPHPHPPTSETWSSGEKWNLALRPLAIYVGGGVCIAIHSSMSHRMRIARGLRWSPTLLCASRAPLCTREPPAVVKVDCDGCRRVPNVVESGAGGPRGGGGGQQCPAMHYSTRIRS